MKLYEINEKFLTLTDLLETEEVTEEQIKDTLESLEMEFEIKADNISRLIRNYLAEADAVKTEKMRLEKKQKALENKAKHLKEYLYYSMKTTGKTKFKTDLFSFNIQNTAQQVNKETLDLSKLPLEYFKEPLPDTTKIKTDLKNGIDVAGAELYTPESLVIR